VSPAPLSSPATPLVPGRAARVTVTAAAALGLVVHLWGLYRDHGPPSVGWFPQADKLEHLVGFGLPCLLVLLALHLHAAAAGRLLGTRAVVVVVGLFVAHAVVSEVVQGTLYTSRSGDPFDVVADVTGTFLGLAAYLVLRRRARSVTAATRTTGQAAHGQA
jgi:VanZ family protein